VQKIINGLAVTAFLLSGSMTAALVVSFFQMEALQRAAVKRITGQITSAVETELTDKLDGKLDDVVNQIPTQTGPAIPFAKP